MRERENREQKNYLPALVLTLIFWGLWIGLILGVDPIVVADFPIQGSYLGFFLIGFLAVWFLSSLLLANKKRGLILSLGLLVYGYLRLWEIDNWMNTVLLAILVIGLELSIKDQKRGEREKNENLVD